MDRTCFVLPLLAGKTEAARAFLRELEGERKPAYAASEELWGAKTPSVCREALWATIRSCWIGCRSSPASCSPR